MGPQPHVIRLTFVATFAKNVVPLGRSVGPDPT